MNIIDNIKLEEINKITWGILFPSSFCDELKKTFGSAETF